MLTVQIKTGDVLDETADVLVSTANPWLNMSGGVNGAILMRTGNAIQEELRAYLSQAGKPHVPPGSVVRTSAGSLNFKHILHAVAIDAFYASSKSLVEQTIKEILKQSQQLGATSVAMPALATGYGPLSKEDFAHALDAALVNDWTPVANLTVVMRSAEDAETVRLTLALGAAFRGSFAESGVDVSLLKENLKLSVTERIEQHQRALEFVEELRRAGMKRKPHE